ncbi:hypothetical protein LPJ72_000491 [Coemansia sp. Benny D160-2]|nr:hypothetical protein LPJ72_000491 [Coemansia sp. Benny D160-2]
MSLPADATTTQRLEEMTSNSSWREALSSKIIEGVHGRTISIGRGRSCMVQIGRKATTISRVHAEITNTGTNHYAIKVLGSNGVRINGTLHRRDSTIELKTDDEVNFVGIKYKFRAPQIEKHDEQDSGLIASADIVATSDPDAAAIDDWWPEPVRKRVAGDERVLEQPVQKRVREMSSEFRGSTDTLVNSSESACMLASDAGFSSNGKAELLAKQMIDELPPSSPIYMNEMADMPFAGEDSHCEDTLPDAIDILETAPSPTPKFVKELAVTAAPAKAHTPRPAFSKENIDPMQPSKQSKPVKARKLQKNSNSNSSSKAGDGQLVSPGKAKSGPNKADEEMMVSLRELLGIVDPSECLADSIDSETEEFLTVQPTQSVEIPSSSSLVDLIIETMVFSARTSHTISDLVRDIARVEGNEATRVWRHHLTRTLFHNRCFGRVERRVKDASDKRAEDKWYYDAAKDECAERRENFGGLVRTARRCTLRDTQYFFKQVPKLPSFRYR